MRETGLVLDAKDIVGESLIYDDRREALVWVDIGGKRIHRLWLADRRHEEWPAPDFPTSIGLDRNGDAIVGLRDRVALWRFGGAFETLAVVEPDLPDNRLNEGKVGPDGAFWVGTMQNNLNPDGSPRDMDRHSGAIYRVTRDGEVTRLTPREFGITNTMAWTGDGRFLTADTLRNEIYAYDFAAGAISNKRLFAGPYPRGFPDGSCLDAEDNLWNCRVAGGSGVLRLSPEGNSRRFRRVALLMADERRLRRGRVRHALRDLGPLHHDPRASPRPAPGRRPLRRQALWKRPARSPLRLTARDGRIAVNWPQSAVGLAARLATIMSAKARPNGAASRSAGGDERWPF